MRYYKITFTNPNGKPVANGANFPASFSSHHDDGTFNPGALEVEFEISNAFGHILAAQTHIRIHNPTLEMIQNARQYNGCICTIEAGFKSGLPLANPNLAGVVGFGVVQNTFANWMGTDLVLDFLLYASADFGSPDLAYSVDTGAGSPFPYSFQWGKGYSSNLIDALKSTFGYQGLTVTGSLNSKLNIQPDPPIKDVKYNFQTFASFINKMSIGIVDPSDYQKGGQGGNFQKYPGVSLFYIPGSKQILAYDGTAAASNKAINLALEEFIGQPTWLNSLGVMQSVHPMRSDVSLGFDIQYPSSLPTLASAQYIGAGRNLLVNPSQGPLRVQQVRHAGRFRDTSATGWVTYIDAGSAFRVNPNANEPLSADRVGQVTIGELQTIQ
jgi:hypothetical protein